MNCQHCGRMVILEEGYWIDPEATGDDSIWRETCDANEEWPCGHEPVTGHPTQPDRTVGDLYG